MKQYTTPEQTAKLIELGFEKPKSVSHCKMDWDMQIIPYRNYSIGELIKMLPKSIPHPRNTSLKFYLAVSFLQSEQWYVDYETCDSALYSVAENELIDALYGMVIELKERGVV